MIKRNWIGKALALALCTAAFPACSGKGTPDNQRSAQAGQLEWSSKAEKELRQAIAEAPANGLKPELFLKGDSDDSATLTQAALRYAEALAHGYADPTKLHQVYTLPRASGDVRPGLAQALDKGEVREWLDSLVPQTDEYKALSQAHLRYLQLAARGKVEAIPDGKAIKPGHRDKRVPAIRAALSANGLLAQQEQQQQQQQQPAPSSSDRYSPDLVPAVKRVQAEFGFKPDGVIGADTLDAINADPAWRARTLAIALERLRWLQRTPPATRIDVNTAATTLDYWRGGQHIDRRNVVTGEPDKQTPQIQASFSQLVANPYWRIPDSIYKEELANKGSGYLARNRMVFKDGRLVQLPGPKNSLGLVKFDMEDPQNIYLHDTPAKALFALPERHRSHGCVRVDNALQFAGLIANQDGALERFQKALASGEERTVKLKTSIAVRLLYHTAYLDDGLIHFRRDVYGWDDDVARALGLARGPQRKAYRHQADDIGP